MDIKFGLKTVLRFSNPKMANSLEFITLKRANITDFSAERNALLDKSKAGWVFFVDSDEVVPDKLRKEIYKAIKDESISGYYVARRNYFIGKYVGTDYIIRLGRKDAGKWVRSVHETWQIKGNVGQLENMLIHHTADNLKDYIKRMDWYSTLHAEANKEEGKKSDLLKIVFYPLAKFFVTFFKSGNTVF